MLSTSAHDDPLSIIIVRHMIRYTDSPVECKYINYVICDSHSLHTSLLDVVDKNTMYSTNNYVINSRNSFCAQNKIIDIYIYIYNKFNDVYFIYIL